MKFLTLSAAAATFFLPGIVQAETVGDYGDQCETMVYAPGTSAESETNAVFLNEFFGKVDPSAIEVCFTDVSGSRSTEQSLEPANLYKVQKLGESVLVHNYSMGTSEFSERADVFVDPHASIPEFLRYYKTFMDCSAKATQSKCRIAPFSQPGFFRIEINSIRGTSQKISIYLAKPSDSISDNYLGAEFAQVMTKIDWSKMPKIKLGDYVIDLEDLSETYPDGGFDKNVEWASKGEEAARLLLTQTQSGGSEPLILLLPLAGERDNYQTFPLAWESVQYAFALSDRISTRLLERAKTRAEHE